MLSFLGGFLLGTSAGTFFGAAWRSAFARNDQADLALARADVERLTRALDAEIEKRLQVRGEAADVQRGMQDEITRLARLAEWADHRVYCDASEWAPCCCGYEAARAAAAGDARRVA